MRAFIFPGQGAQYVGMSRDFYQNFAVARETFEEADDLLGRSLSKIVFEGPEDLLTETRNSQVAIYVASMAILRVLDDVPSVCAGLSLGEYTALTASGRLSFEKTLLLVQARGQFMHDACEANKGTMAAVIGLDGEAVKAFAEPVEGLWVANFNCPGQVVISGTEAGVQKGIELAKEHGARRAIPLKVHGAFHSGLMADAEKKLAKEIERVTFEASDIDFVMNVPGDYVTEDQIPSNLSQQVTKSVNWEGGIRKMVEKGVNQFIEIGCGKTLAGFNKRIGVDVPTISIEKVEDLDAVKG